MSADMDPLFLCKLSPTLFIVNFHVDSCPRKACNTQPETNSSRQLYINETTSDYSTKNMPDSESFAKWQAAYTNAFRPASVGRLIKGTIHNLNGVIQAFSMQTELFEMMFAKSDRQLVEALQGITDESARELVESTLKLLQKRQAMLARMEEKITYSQQLLNTTMQIANASGETEAVSLTKLLEDIIAFFQSDMFFKHKVKVNSEFKASLQIMERQPLCIIMLCLMENAIEAMQDNPAVEPCCTLASYSEDNHHFIEVSNNGPELAAELTEDIFQPFFSTRENKTGLGLYLARQMAASYQGELSFTSSPQQTTFRLTLPNQDI